MNLSELIAPTTAIAKSAGEAILEIYKSSFSVTEKKDSSPLTEADLRSHKIIIDGLKSIKPELPIISEEMPLQSYKERKQWTQYWLIDPLDGTKEFVKRNGEFTVNIALIKNHKPVLGIVHVPINSLTYIGCEGVGSKIDDPINGERTIKVKRNPGNSIRIVGSRSHRENTLETFLTKIKNYELQPIGSSLKFCIVAEGNADLYPRFGPTSEWDTAAAQAVVEQAGGLVLTTDGTQLQYNTKQDILNPHFFVIGSHKLQDLFIEK